MLGIFGHAWASQYGRQPDGVAADTWATALAGITGPQLAAGLQACIVEGHEFPPSAGRFRAMCYGIPSFARVEHEIRAYDLRMGARSRFTYAAWQYVDPQAYRLADARDSRRMLRDAYDMAKTDVMMGHALPDPPVGELAHATKQPEQQEETAEQRAARIERQRLKVGEIAQSLAADDVAMVGKMAAAGPDA